MAHPCWRGIANGESLARLFFGASARRDAASVKIALLPQKMLVKYFACYCYPAAYSSSMNKLCRAQSAAELHSPTCGFSTPDFDLPLLAQIGRLHRLVLGPQTAQHVIDRALDRILMRLGTRGLRQLFPDFPRP